MRSFADLAGLHGRGAAVLGGAGHVGQTASAVLRELGARVAVVDLEERLGGAREADEQLVCDLADESATRAVVRACAERLGRLDVLVHAAALVGTSELEGWAVPFEEQTAEAWDAALAVNLRSAFVAAQEAAPLLREGGHGSIVFVSSIYGHAGPDLRLYDGTAMANPAAYGASKAGLVQLARYLATALAPDVRVNAISPGGIERGQPESFVARYAERTPLRRLATEEDLKGALAFLASDLSAYVTGHDLVVDGGFTAW